MIGARNNQTPEPTMNNDRRKTLKALQDRAEELKSQLEALKGDLEAARDEEQEAYDNMPEGLQNSDKGEKAQAAIDAMDEAVSGVENCIDSELQSFIDNLDTAAE